MSGKKRGTTKGVGTRDGMGLDRDRSLAICGRRGVVRLKLKSSAVPGKRKGGWRGVLEVLR